MVSEIATDPSVLFRLKKADANPRSASAILR